MASLQYRKTVRVFNADNLAGLMGKQLSRYISIQKEEIVWSCMDVIPTNNKKEVKMDKRRPSREPCRPTSVCYQWPRCIVFDTCEQTMVVLTPCFTIFKTDPLFSMTLGRLSLRFVMTIRQITRIIVGF